MKVLVTFALETECSPWRKLRRFERLAPGTYRAVIGGAEVRLMITGMGAKCARAAVRVAFADRPDVCISSGLAGALRPQYARGEVVAARAIVDSASRRVLSSDAALFQAAFRAGARSAEKFCTATEMIVAAAAKKRLSAVAEIVEMESFAILEEAASRKIPAVAVRAISDAADEDLPVDFNRVLGAGGEIRYGRLAARLLRSPHRVPALMRLGQESQRASAALARFLDSYISDLHLDWQPAVAFEPVATIAP